MNKKIDKKVLPIFIAVVSLLMIGAAGEMIASLFEKLKSRSKKPEKSTQENLELAPQL